jgi:flavin reductase (DIM6/NTAB) family NADH-FMN oxidoreductase RutF
MKKNFPLERVYTLLESGPVVLLTTADKTGRADVMPMSWHTMMEFTPPLVGCIVSERNHSFQALKQTKQCALNIPTAELAKQVVRCGNLSGRRVDKFARVQLTPLPAARIDVPLVAECYANLECRVVDAKLVSKYNFFVLEVVKAWVDAAVKRPRTLHHLGHGNFMLPGRTLKLPSKKTMLP